MKYLAGKSILSLASRLVSRDEALVFMTSLYQPNALGYCEAWAKYLGDRLGKQVTVTFSCDNWHIAIRS